MNSSNFSAFFLVRLSEHVARPAAGASLRRIDAARRRQLDGGQIAAVRPIAVQSAGDRLLFVGNAGRH